MEIKTTPLNLIVRSVKNSIDFTANCAKLVKRVFLFMI